MRRQMYCVKTHHTHIARLARQSLHLFLHTCRLMTTAGPFCARATAQVFIFSPLSGAPSALCIATPPCQTDEPESSKVLLVVLTCSNRPPEIDQRHLPRSNILPMTVSSLICISFFRVFRSLSLLLPDGLTCFNCSLLLPCRLGHAFHVQQVAPFLRLVDPLTGWIKKFIASHAATACRHPESPDPDRYLVNFQHL